MFKKRNISNAPLHYCTIALLHFFLIGCGSRSQTTFEFMPNMMDQPSIKAQEVPMRVPVAGTIPRGFTPYPYAQSEREFAGQNLTNVFSPSREVYVSGQQAFTTYCAVCHGARGQGDGSVVPPFPRPPSLTSEKIRGWKDGEIFHVITTGQNLMPSYASQISREDRWRIVHYVRVLQRAEHPTSQDIERLKALLEDH